MNPIVSLDYYDEDYINKFKGMIAWLLYSDNDKEFAKYLMESWNALERLSGESCLITLIEQPYNENNVIFWSDINLSEENSKIIYEFLLNERTENSQAKINEWLLNFKPYSNEVLTKTAEKLDVPVTEIPCLVFYTKTSSKDYLVYSFSNDWTLNQISGHMKEIFTLVKKYTGTEWFAHLPQVIKTKKILINLESDFRKIKGAKFVKRMTNNTTIGNIIKEIYSPQ
jgi:hypothetical protein